MTTTLRGRIISDGQPVLGAQVRLFGEAALLAGDRHAVADQYGAITWTRVVRDYDGNLWSAWQKFVAHQVAGITWAEFRSEAVLYNPALRLTDGRFRAEKTYALPEHRTFADTPAAAPTIVWDRPLIGFGGSRWDCWRQFVQGKVVGLSWPEFERQIMQHNPVLTQSRGRMRADVRYLLPRNMGRTHYVRVAYGDPLGRFLIAGLSPGTYQIEIVADGYRQLMQEIVVSADEDMVYELRLIPLVLKRSSPFVQAYGRHFHVNGRSFRFVGVNLRGLAHYGTAVLPWADARTQLNAAREIGARVIRIFLPHRSLTVAEIKTRLHALIDLLRAEYREMYLIVVLTNLYGDAGFDVPGDWNPGQAEHAYTLRRDNADLLDLAWFRHGYARHYLPFVQTIVEAFRDEPTIMAWDIGNELKAEGDPGLLVQFMHDAARQIRRWDPNHLITTGMISTRHAWMHVNGNEFWQEKLYQSPLLDFITNHTYHDDDDPNTDLMHENWAASREDDSALARHLNKPLLIEEAGFKDYGDRRPLYEKEIAAFLSGDGRMAVGYLPWGFMIGPDNGDGDNNLGIDEQKHRADWKSICDLLRSWARHLAEETTELLRPDAVGSRLAIGQRVFAVAGLRLRPAPGLAAAPIYMMPQRGPVIITGDMVEKDELRWWPVSLATATGETHTGWMAQTDEHGNITLSVV